MSNWNFEAGKQVDTPSQPEKPEWPDAMLITIPNRRQAWRVVREILAQLQEEDAQNGTLSGVTLTLHGELSREEP